MSKDAFYFPHFCNARHDRKIKRCMKELGIEGYGIFFMLLETLREQADYKYPMLDIDLLADEFGTSESKLRTVICNYQLFDVDENENFFSSKLMVYLQPYIEQKEVRKIGGIKGNLIKYCDVKKEDLTGFNNQDILLLQKELEVNGRSAIASKVKEIKANKSKVKDNKLIPHGISEVLTERFIEFIEMRKRIKKPIKTERPINALVNQVGKSFVNEDHLIQCLDYAMDNEYQGVKAEYVKYNTQKKSYRTTEEERYYKLLDMARKDPDGVTSEEIEEKRVAMEKSLEGIINA